MIYLDNAATSNPKPQCAIDATVDFLCNINSNSGRSAHSLSIESARILLEARIKLSKLIGQSDIFRTIFTLNATMAINSCLYGILKENDSVLITSLEHNSVIRPLKELERTKKINIKTVPFSSTCSFDKNKARKMAKGCKLIICIHANNVTGAVLPVEFFSELAKENNSYFLVDASQSIGSITVDMQKDSIDFLCASAHKGLLAPMGLGFFSFSSRIDLDEFSSFYQGGTGSRSEDILQPDLLPDKYESGTLNMPAIAGLDKSIDWINEQTQNNIYQKKVKLRKMLHEGLKNVSHVRICEIDKTLKTTSVLSFYLDNKSLSETATLLNDTYNIYTRVGLHCNPLTHKCIGTLKQGGTIRVSPSYFTTEEEIIYTINAIREIANA